MPIQQSYSFDNASNFTLTNTQITSNVGKLALVPNPGVLFAEDFADDTGFTYDSNKTEFVAGILRQKDQRPLNSAFAANFNLGNNSNYNNLVPTIGGAAVVMSGKLNCNGLANNYFNYDDATIGNIGSQVTIKFKFTPNYTGSPSANTNIFSIEQASHPTSRNIILMMHSTSGTLRHQWGDDTGIIVSVGTSQGTLLGWSPVAGTEYEFEYNLNTQTGEMRLFINGVLFDSKLAMPTATRGTGATRLRIGAGSSYLVSNGTYDDFIIFNNVQHTGNYTPGYSFSNYAYQADKIDGPSFQYTGVGTVLTVDDGSVTEVGLPRFIVGLRWWNGSAWVLSNGTYSEANDFATILANLGAFVATGATLIPWSVLFTDSNSLSSVDEFDIEVTGQKYATNGRIETVQSLQAKALVNYSDTVVETLNSSIGRVIKVDGVPKYWDGDSWETSNLSEAQTNTATEINDNLDSLVLGSNSSIKPCWIFFSSANTETSEISLANFGYDFGLVETEPTTCLVVGYIRNISGIAISGVKLNFKINSSSLKYHEANKNITSPLVVQAITDVNGYFSIPLVRSSQYENAIDYVVTIDYGSSQTVEKSLSGKLIFDVPDAETKDITDLLPLAS